jgi:hypothetical protein
LLVDRAYDNDLLRQTVADQGGWANIRPLSYRRRAPVLGPFFSHAAY